MGGGGECKRRMKLTRVASRADIFPPWWKGRTPHTSHVSQHRMPYVTLVPATQARSLVFGEIECADCHLLKSIVLEESDHVIS